MNQIIRADQIRARNILPQQIGRFSELVNLGVKFPVILADPPWKNIGKRRPGWRGNWRSAERHYETLAMEEIKQLPIAGLAQDNCLLLLWTTMQHIPQALQVIEAWEFTYKTVGLVWVKSTKKSNKLFWGMGQWTRSNAELCLLATRGKPKRKNANVHQVIFSTVTEHSQKPPEAIKRIEALADGPYLELFARKIDSNNQWRAWGNEARVPPRLI